MLMINMRELKKEILRLKKWTRSCYPSVFDQTDKNVGQCTFTRYWSARVPINRGYFCPNSMEEVVIGNAHRGCLCEERPDSNWCLAYHFDETGLLRVIDAYEIDKVYSREVLFYAKDEVLGIGFDMDSDGEISLVVKETYEHGKEVQVLEYSHLFWKSTSPIARLLNLVIPPEIRYHKYEYQDGRIASYETWAFIKLLCKRPLQILLKIASIFFNVPDALIKDSGTSIHEVYRCGYSDTGKMNTLEILDLSNNPKNDVFERMDFKGHKNVHFTFEELHRVPVD